MDWPHAPVHRLFTPGSYIVTAGTYKKHHHFHTPARLDYFTKMLFELAAEFGWSLQAWAVMSNHYHFVALSPESGAANLRSFIGKLHMLSAKQVNAWDGQHGRKVWHEYWDTELTFEKSYLARLNYVHRNPEKHGIAMHAEDYAWCSAKWFSESAPKAFVQTVRNFKVDQVSVPDDF